MRFHVVVMPKAAAELDGIIAWVASRSPQGAARLWASFENGLRSLEVNPLSCSIAPESDLIGREVRQLFFKTRKGRTYRALFDIRGDQVRVLRVRGPGQKLLDPDEF